MPELAEIKRFSYIINSNGRGKTFKEPRLALPPPFAGNAFRMRAIARGKELRVALSLDTNSDSKIWVLFTHGLVGRWEWRAGPETPTSKKGIQLSFEATDGQGALQFIDVQKMGKWNVTTESWGKGRGADPVDEFELFKKNILDNRAKKDFEQPIGELLLDQKYFNGVGNYLRAEILCRAGILPLTKAFQVFQNEQKREKLLNLCRLIPMEVLQLGLNKYGNPKEVEEFQNWMRCYGKAKSQKDKGGRMLWYFEDQTSREEPLPQLDEAGYRSMFPLGGEAPVSSTLPAPSTSSFSFSAPAQPNAQPTMLSVPIIARAASGGSYQDFLTEPSWRNCLEAEFQKPYWTQLMSFLQSERKCGTQIFPPENEVFTAFNLCPVDSIRVVILGQDPYHDDGQAHGLCFSVKPGIKPPPSLRNIYTELTTDVRIEGPKHVEAHKANSHAGKGWESFTDAAIKVLAARSGIVFILWGGYAQKKGANIDTTKHCVLNGAHPSPLSATKFYGCKHFSKANAYLTSQGKLAMDWSLPSVADPDVGSTSTSAHSASAAPSTLSATKFSFPSAQGPAKKVSPQPPQVFKFSSSTSVAPAVGSWKCRCCEVDNEASHTTCTVCFAPSPPAASPFKSASPFQAASPLPSTSSGFSFASVPAPGAQSEQLEACKRLVVELLSNSNAWPFSSPVDYSALNLVDYHMVIKYPMDLGTVKSKLAAGSYANALACLSDVRQVFTNAVTYSQPNSDVARMALHMKGLLTTLVTQPAYACLVSHDSGFGTASSTTTSFSSSSPAPPQGSGTLVFGAPATALPVVSMDQEPAAEAVSRMGRMLLLLSTLHKADMLTLEQKYQLKDLAIARDKLIFSALEAFAADEDRDLREAADTFVRILKHKQR